MSIFLVLVLFLLLFQSRINEKDSVSFYSFDREQTTSIKGIFAVIIFLSHVRGYITTSDVWYNYGYNFTLNQIGQLMVVMFLFYSGYGIVASAKNNSAYFQRFPIKRIAKTWFHLAVCVILFLIMQLALSNYYSLGDVLLAFIGWTSIGNSNWFMLVILILYIATYILSLFIKDYKKLSFAMLFVTLLVI